MNQPVASATSTGEGQHSRHRRYRSYTGWDVEVLDVLTTRGNDRFCRVCTAPASADHAAWCDAPVAGDARRLRSQVNALIVRGARSERRHRVNSTPAASPALAARISRRQPDVHGPGGGRRRRPAGKAPDA